MVAPWHGGSGQEVFGKVGFDFAPSSDAGKLVACKSLDFINDK